MMKLALIALPSEIRVFARCLSRIREIDWVGFGGYACTVPYISLGQGPESEKKVRYYASVDKLTDAADVLLVAGRQEDRFRYVSKALRKGKPVWAIGPVGRTWEETAKLASLAQEACVCNQAAHLARESGLVQAVLPYMTGVRLVRAEAFCPPFSRLNADWENRLLFPAFDRLLAVSGSSVRKTRVRSTACMGYAQAGAVVDMEFMSGAEAFLWVNRVAERHRFYMAAMSPIRMTGMDFLSGKIELREVPPAADGSAYISRSGPCRVPVNSFFPEIKPVRPLLNSIQAFVDAVSAGSRSRFGFLQSSEVQERFTQLKRMLYAS